MIIMIITLVRKITIMMMIIIFLITINIIITIIVISRKHSVFIILVPLLKNYI